jgi:hypothetical protein
LLDLKTVYFAQNPHSGAVKIGYTGDDPVRRLASLATGAGCELSLLRCIDGGRRTERWLHERFADRRVFGEWFEFDAAMLQIVPPDEIVFPIQITKRRDVRLTVWERLKEARKSGAEVGLSERQILLTFATALNDAEASALMEMAAHADALEAWHQSRAAA